MQIAVCDDNPDFLEAFSPRLRVLPQVEAVSCFSSLSAFLRSIEDGRRFDTVLLDIDWAGKESGLDAAERLEALCPWTRVIFVTGFNDRFSQKIFLRSANLSGYLVKPVDEALLTANLDKIARELRQEEEPALVLRSRGEVLTIPYREILYLEGREHHVSIHTLTDSMTVYNQLDRVQKSLPAGFYRCHKSFIVNMAHIRRFRQPDILLKTGGTVPVSRARFTKAKAAYFQYMGQTF